MVWKCLFVFITNILSYEQASFFTNFSLVLMAFPWHCTDLNAHTVVLQEWSVLTILEKKILCFKTIILKSSSAFLFSISLSICSKLYSFHSEQLSIIIVWQFDMISTNKKSQNTFTLAITRWFHHPVLSYNISNEKS